MTACPWCGREETAGDLNELDYAGFRYDGSSAFADDAWDAAAATRPAELEEHVAAWWREQPGYRTALADIANGDREV